MDPLIVGALLSVGVTSVGLKRWQAKKIRQFHRQRFRYVRILPHELVRTDDQKLERLIELFGGFNRPKIERWKRGRDWFRWLVHKDKQGKVSFYFGYPEDRTTGVQRAFLNAYPEAELHKVGHSEIPLPKVPSKTGYGGYFVPTKQGDQEGLPLQMFKAAEDGLPDILSCLDAGEKETEVWLDLLFSPTSNRELKRVVEKASNSILNGSGGTVPGINTKQIEQFGREVWKEMTSNGTTKSSAGSTRSNKASLKELDGEKQEQLKSLRRRFTGRESAFQVSVSLYVEGNYASSVAQTAATSIRKTMEFDNGLRLVKKNLKEIGDTAPIPSARKLMLWTGKELANLFHLPSGDTKIYQYVPHLKKGQRTLKEDELNNGISLGTLNHPVSEGRPVKLPKGQFTKHFVLTGKTGSGKSSEALMIVQSLLDDWLENPSPIGFTYFDPARETVATILTRLRKAELEGKKVDWSKVHYFYLGPSEYSIGLNLLHNIGNEEPDSIVGSTLGLMKYAYGGDTPQMDRIVRNTLMTLVEDRDPHTVLGIVPLLTNEEFRNRIVPRVTDPITKQFWKNEFPDIEGKMGQAIGPILNRLSPFTNNKAMRRMFGQLEWGLDLKRYMDEGHILLFDIVNLGEEQIKLACGHLANQYYKTAKTRNTGANPHLLIYDESHLVQLPVMAKIIAETRKFGLCLGLITQYANQYEPWLIEAISENVGTILTCLQGPKSAAAVSAMTAGHFDKQYLMELPSRTIAVFTSDKDETGRDKITTFTVEADPPYVYKADGQVANHENEDEMRAALEWGLEKGRELSKRDGKHIREVDAEINSYLQTGTALQEAARAQIKSSTSTRTSTRNVPSLLRDTTPASVEEVAAAFHTDESKKKSASSWEDY